MSTAIDFGRSKIRLSVEDCFYCGTSFSSGWQAVTTVGVIVGARRAVELTVHACSECIEKRERA